MAISTINVAQAVTYPGAVLQVVSTAKTDTFSSSSVSWVDITNLSLTITPKSSSSKILLISELSVSNSQQIAYTYCYFRYVRNSTAIGLGDASGSKTQVTGNIQAVDTGSMQSGCLSYLDSPATTSAITYKVQLFNQNGSWITYINRSATDTDTFNFARAISTITAMEIAG